MEFCFTVSLSLVLARPYFGTSHFQGDRLTSVLLALSGQCRYLRRPSVSFPTRPASPPPPAPGQASGSPTGSGSGPARVRPQSAGSRRSGESGGGRGEGGSSAGGRAGAAGEETIGQGLAKLDKLLREVERREVGEQADSRRLAVGEQTDGFGRRGGSATTLGVSLGGAGARPDRIDGRRVKGLQ